MITALQPDHCIKCMHPSCDKACVVHLQDAQSVAWLERTLAAFKGTVVAVTHDRCAVIT